MRMSAEAFEDIVEDEVSSQKIYERKYRKPEWPGESSGVTVGIGYDLGQTSAATIRSDWTGRVSDAMLQVMVRCSGTTGDPARALTSSVRNQIDIPWETAISVHRDRVVPRWEAKLIAALPNTDRLHPDSFGALVSLIFNRGPSFRNKGPRYVEMRNIRAHMIAQKFDRIPDEIRAMKRLWTLRGLLLRRDREAALFEKGLDKNARVAPSMQRIATVDTTRTPKADPIEDVKEESAAPHGEKSIELEVIQTDLKALGYHEVGMLDGGWGGRTAAAIAAFKNDRHLPGEPVVDDALKAEIDEAKAEKWTRPIAKERAEGVPEDSRIIEASEKQAAVGSTTGGLFGGGGLVAWAATKFQWVQDTVEPIMPVVKPFITLLKDFWWVGLLGGVAYLLVQNAKIRKARIDDHQKGITP